MSSPIIVSYRVIGSLEEPKLSMIVDASLDGLRLATDRPMKAGTHLALEIQMPEYEESLQFIGRVVESSQGCDKITCDTRLEFLSVDTRSKKLFDTLMAKYRAEEKQEPPEE